MSAWGEEDTAAAPAAAPAPAPAAEGAVRIPKRFRSA
jgi:hypothetical protein